MWNVEFDLHFKREFDSFDQEVQDELLRQLQLLRAIGPELGRPRVDTLKGSKYPNMKELRFDAADGVWRTAFAFDPQRQAILLVAGDKSGVSERRFYSSLIAIADQRYTQHLAALERESAHAEDRQPRSSHAEPLARAPRPHRSARRPPHR